MEFEFLLVTDRKYKSNHVLGMFKIIISIWIPIKKNKSLKNNKLEIEKRMKETKNKWKRQKNLQNRRFLFFKVYKDMFCLFFFFF